MEPIGGIASILSILEAAACVSNVTAEIYREFRDAPKELARLAARISRIRSRIDVQLQIYRSLSGNNLDNLVSAEALKTLQADLQDAVKCLDVVQDSVSATGTYPNGKQRCVWVFKDKRRVTRVVQNLRDVDTNLSALLTTLSLALSVRSNELISGLTTSQKVLIEGLKIRSLVGDTASAHSLGEGAPRTSSLASIQLTTTRAMAMWTTAAGSNYARSDPRHIREARTSMTTGYQKDELRSRSWILGFLRLPLFLSSYAIYITVRLWLFRLSCPRLEHSLALKKIVPRHSSFIQACAAGELLKARQLALCGEGSPSSIDETGMPALHHAVRSGSFEVVQFLLHNGATAEDMDARCYVSPLQVACRHGYSDIARLLLAKGALLEHADSCGRTAFTMLWYELSRCFCRADFLEMLLAYSPMPAMLESSGPVSPVSCAAMKGNIDDLRLLQNSGICSNLEGTAGDRLINYSIFGSNPATFDFLMPLTPSDWISEVDSRGRGPLHLALEYPSMHTREIVKRLLNAGADVFAKDEDGNDPGDLARICDDRAKDCDYVSYSNLRAYCDALVSCGFEVELDEDGNLWWP